MKKKIDSSVSLIPVTPVFQIILFLINYLFVIVCSYYFHKNFYSLEYFPNEDKSIVHKKNPILCDIKIYEFFNVNINSGLISVRLNLNLKIDKNFSKKDFKAEKILSDLIFENANIHEKKILKELATENKVEYFLYYELTFHNKFIYKLYPFDDHVLLININIPYELFDMTIEPNIEIENKNDVGGCEIRDIKKISEFDRKFNCQNIKIFMQLSKHTYRTALSVFIPLFIILFINLFSMSVNLIEGRKLIITSLLALNSFRIVIENNSPKIFYFTAMDNFYILYLFIALIIFIIHILEIEMRKIFSYFFIIFAYSANIFLFFYYVWPWIIKDF